MTWSDIEIAAQTSRSRWLIAARYFAACLDRASALRKFSPDQPRAPAGSPDGGQWTSGDLLTPVGGFDHDDLDKSVQTFVSQNCQGKIYQVLPGQFLHMHISEVMKLAKSGDAAARTCLKILGRDEYRK